MVVSHERGRYLGSRPMCVELRNGILVVIRRNVICYGLYMPRKAKSKMGERQTDTFGTMTAASRVAEDRHQFRRDIWAATS